MSDLIPRTVTVEQLNAVANQNPVYKAACQVMLNRGIWQLKEGESWEP